MFCQLCGKPLPAGSTTNMCQECANSLNGSAARLVPNQTRTPVVANYNKPTPTNKAAPPNYPRPNAPAPYAASSSSQTIEMCKTCNRAFPANQLYQVQPRSIHVRPIKPTTLCAADVQKLKAEWRQHQIFKSADLLIAGAMGLLLMVVLSFFWSLGVPITFQVITFVVMLIGWAGGKTIYYALGKRKGPTPGILAGIVALVGLLIAFYFMYSQLSGQTLASPSEFFSSIGKNGLPFQTVIYFVIAWLLAVAQCLELEPDVRDYQGNRISLH